MRMLTMTGPRMTRPRGCGASDEDEQAAQELKEADVMHPAGGDHDADELGDGRAGWRWWRRDKGMEDVGAENYEHEAQEDTADEVEVFHGGRHSFGRWVER